MTRAFALAAAALAGIAAGGLLHLAGAPVPGDAAWALGTALVLVPLTSSVAGTLLRRDVGVDAIALVAIAGALALGEYLAGAAATPSRRSPSRTSCPATSSSCGRASSCRWTASSSEARRWWTSRR